MNSPHRAFERRCQQAPHDVAVRCGGAVWTYAELNAAANQFAHALRAKGLQRGQNVAVHFPRSLELLAAILGVVKAGGCYLPLDPQAPEARLNLILKDAQAAFVLSNVLAGGLHLSACQDQPTHNLDLDTAPQDPFYLIYTSGSTGTPKGALVSHAGAMNLYEHYVQALGLHPDSRFLVVSSIGFDLTQKNLWCPLMAGGTVVFLATPRFEPEAVLDTILAEGISNLNCTPSAFYGLIESAEDQSDDAVWQRLQPLKQLALGGEPVNLPRLALWRKHCPLAEIINGYGPTECSAVVAMHTLPNASHAPDELPLGVAVPNVSLHILDEHGQPTEGKQGELHIGGMAVGLGYWQRPELTAEKFIPHPTLGLLYKSGDDVIWQNGLLYYRGRRDFQVKLHGNRIELGEIEAALQQHPDVLQAVVKLRPERDLIAFVQGKAGLKAGLDVAELRPFLAKTLPEFMLPSQVIGVDAFPLNANGKIDRHALALPLLVRPDLSVPYAPASNALESQLQQAFEAVLGVDRVGVDDPFFELGGTSALAMQLLGRLGRQLQRKLSVAGFFAAPTVRGYAQSLNASLVAQTPTQTQTQNLPKAAKEDLAIVGMALRVPGADTPDQFWHNLVSGVESIRPLTDEELLAAGIAPEVFQDPDYVRMAPTLDGAECFDAAFFGYTAREAELMDPQQRLLHELSWAALEDAGYNPQAVSQTARVGVFAGVARNSYFTHNVVHHPSTRDHLAEVHLTFVNDKDYAATHVAHKLNLTGPAVTAQTACSTGGVLLHLARQSLLAGDCEIALVAGARVMSPTTAGHPWIDGSIFTRDGHMKVFDADGTGMIRGSGVIVLVLKRLSQALADRDRVLALVKGTALNNDGNAKAGYTAPSVQGQAEVIGLALAEAGVNAGHISYIEAHGTGTPVGDPIEIEALTQAFRQHTADAAYCAIGSVKSNIGHLDPAAALAGIAKTVLALQHQHLPPTLGFTKPNPHIDFASSPFVVQSQGGAWREHAGTRLAGVSAFGIGGTNFHGVFEQAPATPPSAQPARAWQLLPFSAKTDTALHQQWQHLQAALSGKDAGFVADAAFTLQTGRAALNQRGVAVVKAGEAFAEPVLSAAGVAREVVFVFPGQGSQHPQMGKALYEQEPIFKQAIDEGCAHLEPLLGVDLREVIYNEDEDSADILRQTGLAQPAIYLISYATALLWQSLGVQPVAMVGHSVGEYVAATLAGVFSFKDALTVLAARARLMQSMPSGAMLAVRQAADALTLPEGISLAAINAPKLSIVSGEHTAIAAYDAALKDAGVATVALHTSHAFHSEMMEPVLEAFTAVVKSVPRHAPTGTIVSTLTGLPLTAEEATSPDYWAQQLRQAVRFSPAIQSLVKDDRVFLEVGPAQALSGPIKQSGAKYAVASLPPAAQAEADAQQHWLLAVGRLWLAGLPLPGLLEPRQKVALPTYPFARTRHWLDVRDVQVAKTVVTSSEATSDASNTPTESSANQGLDVIGIKALAVLEEVTGQAFEDHQKTFLELGMDSLLLTQVAGKLKSTFKVDLRFRQLLEGLNTVEKLLLWLRERASAPVASKAVESSEAAPPTPKKAFGAAVRISKEQDLLAPSQRKALDALIHRYVAKTKGSKAAAQQHRKHFADPRTVSGFKPMWKESVYPIVSTRSDGAHVWDVDGNQYIDTVNGFGSTIFGHKPKFIDEALRAQIDKGYEVGPVQDFLGELAERFTRMVKLERVAFCNTGSEAVSAAQRCARTVTGKDLIASFTGDYHGVHDEVIVRPGPNGKGFPAASGIPNAHTSQTLILDYTDPKSLDILRERADELAAILIEPIQSRNQDYQPREFIHALRKIATEAGCAFIMDEVITGFRIAPGGAQEYFGVEADLATYGKVFGGGLPVGAVAGCSKFMDALDGGFWQFGDASVPEAGVTFFAGTFVRHPLPMAASLASLRHLEANPDLQRTLNARVAAFVARLREGIALLKAPVRVTTYTSIFRFEASQEEPFFELLAHYFRLNGIHTYDHRNQVMTTAHTDAVFDQMYAAYVSAIEQMQTDGLLGVVGAPVRVGLLPGMAARLPMTEAQKEVWLACELEPAATLAYNEAGRLTLHGALNTQALREALSELVQRHEALRSVFDEDSQIVLERLDLPLIEADISLDPKRQLAEIEAEELSTPFDLSQGPLIRWRLLKESDTCHHLIKTAHHIIVDGWSSWVISNELSKLYSAKVKGEVLALPAAPRYADYAKVEREFVSSDEGQQHLDYWLNALQSPPPVLDIPHDLPRPSERSYAANRVDIHLDAALVAKLRRVGASQGASLVATTLAAFVATAHKQTGAEDMLIGLAAAGQSFHQFNGLVGHAVNLLPLRLKPQANQPFTALLDHTRSTVLDAFDHQGASFGGIVPALQFERDFSRPPLLSTLFNVDVRAGDIVFDNLQHDYHVLKRQAEVFELFINLVDNGHDLVLEASYNQALFSEASIQARMAEYVQVLTWVAEQPETLLSALPWVPKTQREQVLEAFNARPSQAPARSLQEILLNTAVAQGDKTAVIFADQRQSYAELNQASARIAAALLAEGVGKGSYVAVCLERSLNVPAVLWGVLRAGAAYVALDPIFPLARIQTVLESAGAALLLADQSLLNDWPSLPCPALAVETALQAPAAAVNDVVATAADAPAYVVFTSGSTGKPKGVVLAQGGLVNCLSSLSRAPGLRAEETALAVATLAFDFSVYEIFLPLWVGATLVIADLETTTDGDRLKALIAQHRITSSHATPATMRLLQAAGWAGTPDFRMVFGGEPLPRDLVAWLLPRIAEIWNIYGPTETTITSNLCRVVSAEGIIPVGAPIEGVRCYVLNPAHEPLPVGVAGELYIGGAGVGLGYLNQPDLTAERFISNPFHGGTLYRSGDLARWLADGSIEILGRIDTQVKLRGYRMELGEIEHVLAQHPDVLEAVVSVRQRITADQGKDDRLVAWLAVGASSVPASELRQWCREALPSYMVPQSFVLLDSLPRLLNGKIDHKSLPNPFADQAVIVAKTPPSTDNQRLIASLWAQVLGVPEDSIGVDDRFFDLGGHSLLAVQVAAQIQQKTGSKPVLRGVLMNPLSALADSLPVVEAVPVEAIQPAAPPAEAVLPVALPNAPTRAWWQRLLFRED